MVSKDYFSLIGKIIYVLPGKVAHVCEIKLDSRVSSAKIIARKGLNLARESARIRKQVTSRCLATWFTNSTSVARGLLTYYSGVKSEPCERGGEPVGRGGRPRSGRFPL